MTSKPQCLMCNDTGKIVRIIPPAPEENLRQWTANPPDTTHWEREVIPCPMGCKPKDSWNTELRRPEDDEVLIDELNDIIAETQGEIRHAQNTRNIEYLKHWEIRLEKLKRIHGCVVRDLARRTEESNG